MSKKKQTPIIKNLGLVTAIELGTNNIRGIVARKKDDGKIEILAKESLKNEGIKRGQIENITDVAYNITDICAKLTNRLKMVWPNAEEKGTLAINGIYVTLNGNMKTVNNKPEKSLRGEMISEEIVNDLRKKGETCYEAGDGYKVLDVFEQEYIVDDEECAKPIGRRAEEKIVARYKVVCCKKNMAQNLTDCFNEINKTKKLTLKGYSLSPVAAASAALTDNDKELGTVVVDFGATSIGVCIYKNKRMRYTRVIPVGSNIINKDLGSLQIVKSETSKLKKMYDKFYDKAEEQDTIISLNESQKDVNISYICKTIETREKDLAHLVQLSIEESGLKAGNQLQKIVMLGKGSRLGGWGKMLTEETGLRVEKGHLRQDLLVNPIEAKDPDNFLQCVGVILAAQKEDCVTTSLQPKEKDGIFGKITKGFFSKGEVPGEKF